ncbi:hypothetical protein BH20CHL6_BH20CHL6_06840 [soil metagenome]
MGTLIRHVRTPLYANAYAMMLSTGISSVLGVVYWALGARLYSTEVVGVNSAMISTMIFLSGVAQLNLRVVLNRFVPVAGAASTRLVAISYLAVTGASAIVGLGFIGVLQVLAPPAGLEDLRVDAAVILWFVASTITWSIFNLQDGVFTGLRQALWVPLENGLYGAVKVVVLIVLAAPMAGYGIFISWTLPVAAAVLLVNLLLFRRLLPRHVARPRLEATTLVPRQLLRFILVDYLASLLVLAYSSLLPILVLGELGPSAGAHFYIVWFIYTAVQYVPLQMSVSLTVEAVVSKGDPYLQARTVLVHMARLLAPMIAVLTLGAPVILSVFGTSYAAEGSSLLQLLSLSIVPFSVNLIYFSLARVHARVAGIIVVQTVLLIGVLGLGTTLLPRLGINGIGVAWLVSQTVVAVALLGTRLRPVWRAAAAPHGPA